MKEGQRFSNPCINIEKTIIEKGKLDRNSLVKMLNKEIKNRSLDKSSANRIFSEVMRSGL